MPLFDSLVPRHLLWPINAPWPKRRAHMLLSRFQASFPELIYDMDLDVDLANAQAFLDGGRKRVRLFGGLARHRKIGSAGLAFTLAHETGHHLGGSPYLQAYPWLSSEERATEWAMSAGLPKVFGDECCKLINQKGREELSLLGNFSDFMI